MSIGIDHIAVYIPNQYLALEDLALARNVDPNKFLIGLGNREMAIASKSEDVVVLAANAGKRVLEEAGVDPRDIGFLSVGTESALDRAKPTATHVHELLGISSACRVFDVMHACAGATYGVLSAIDWLQNPKNKYALIIASDIANYGKGSPGEPTQGAGAVAILLTANPRLMHLEEVSNYSKNVYDFWKPWDKEFPVVDGVYSSQCYLEAARNCFDGQSIDHNAAFLYHTPYPKLIKHAHSNVISRLGLETNSEQHYQEKVAPFSEFSSRIGNIYTGSLWLTLANYLEISYASQKNNLPGLKKEFGSTLGCYLFSYGSGCGAVLMRGLFSGEWSSMAKFLNIYKMLDDRLGLTVEEYENVVDGKSIGKNFLGKSLFKYDGLKNDRREYSPIPQDNS
jgi:hydroxymethylglutaryl-CoA synthase